MVLDKLFERDTIIAPRRLCRVQWSNDLRQFLFRLKLPHRRSVIAESYLAMNPPIFEI